ncbi:MAG TPA: A/G-specific adenine glycosylase [Thermoanaerobaculia bacterium]|nr:A/G-specific adenine glycosylase [Thermoanaerobaculia bacterium]
MPVPAATLTISVESWFLRNQRPLPWRAGYDPYLVWVSEVMLQQTRMEVVLRYFGAFIDRFPTLGALAAASDEEVLTLWSGLGYYRRARMLAAGAREVVARFGGAIPHEVTALQSIPGIGRYTAGAIASIAFGQRAPIVDGNVARVLARVFAIAEPVGSPRLMAAAWQHAAALVEASADPRSLNQGLMEIGALVCTPQKPDCPRCPLRHSCAARAAGREQALPLPKTKRVTRKMVVPLYLIGDGAGRFLMRRESGGLMTSMFHLPHGSTDLLPGMLDGVIERELIGSFRHTITTRNVEFVVHRATLLDRIADSDGHYTWVHPSDLRNLPHPSYVAKAMRLTITG